jgi:hypothetical protein
MMQKWIGAGVLVVVAGGGLAWQQGWLDGGDGPSAMSAYVPADTVLYLGGSADPALLRQLRTSALLPSSQGELNELLAELDDAAGSTPATRFMRHLLADLLTHSTTYGALIDHYGFDLTRPQAIYLDGMVPVIRLGLADEASFWAVLDEASAASGLQPREEQLGEASVRVWRLSPDSGRSVELAVRVEAGTATLSFFIEGDDSAAKRLRMALDRPQSSLADSGELEEIRQRHGFDTRMTAFLHLQRLMRGVMEPDSNSLARQLHPAIRASGGKPIEAYLPASCRNELVELAAQVPRLVAGHIGTTSAGRLSSRTVLELKNSNVVTNLSKLRGHIPTHSLEAENQIVGLGLGLDIDNLVPASTALWNQFLQADFSCPQLVSAQQRMAKVSPAMMGAFAGMIQGTAGAGFSLYDLTLNPSTAAPEQYDFLFSIATANPQPLLSLLGSTPFGRRIDIPQDGSLGKIDLSFLAPGLAARAGIQGNHIVVFKGEKAQRAVDKIGAESLDANGLTNLNVNYPRLADLVDRLPASLAARMESGSESGCIAQVQLSELLRSQAGRIAYRTDINREGWVTDMEIWLDTEAREPIDPVGRFTVVDKTFECEAGEAAGQEEIRKDGSGRYVYADDQCELYRSDYNWSVEGRMLQIDTIDVQQRERCSDAWTPGEVVDTQCRLIPAASGFRCLFDDEGGKTLLHYIPR